MKPHPPIRKTIKYGGAAVTVLLVVVWIGSGWLWASLYTRAGYLLAVARGRFQLSCEPGFATGRTFTRAETDHPYSLSASPAWGATPKGWFVSFPMWPLIGASLIATVAAFRLDQLARQRGANLCPKCGYDRAGLAAGARCPECGNTPKIG